MPPGNSGRLIRLSKSCLSAAEKAAVMGVLDREYLGMGAEVQEFELALQNFFGRPVACVSTGTAALQLALQACGIGSGDEVLVQSLTYVASFQAISATGAKPVACDIEQDTFTLDWRDAERRLTPRTKAVMPVHYTGGIGALNNIYRFAGAHNLHVVEDAAHAFGSTDGANRIGSFGEVACFSFDGIKNITSGEGGCVVAAEDGVLQRVRDSRLLGVVKDTDKRYAGERSWDFDVTSQGWRYHMSNIMAALGLAQLHRFPQLAAARQKLARTYDRRLCEVERVHLIAHDYSKVVPHIYAVRIRGLEDRQGLQMRLLERGIQTGMHYQPNHWLTYYREDAAAPLPVTEELYSELLSVPLHPDLTEVDVHYVCDELISAIT